MRVIKAMTIMHEIKEINIFLFKSLRVDLNPAELSVPSFASLIILSLFHVYIYISLTLCYICYLGLIRTEVFHPQCKYWFIFVSQGTSFYECKIGGIIQKVVFFC